MPRQNRQRTITSEVNLADRIAVERETRGLSYEALAKAMSEAGCPIQGSALFRIEKGTPQRRVTVNELVALAAVFETDLDDLLRPTGEVRRQRALVVAGELEDALIAYDDAVMRGLRLYVEYGKIAAEDPELLEFLNHHAFRSSPQTDRPGVELGPLVADEDVRALRRQVAELWGAIARLGQRASGVTS